ncbi:DUF1353 domain-containing protein [Noviherbaspirillum sp. ST9]|uniref:DUF1353 domain-containing protein n=1 Tax=Noviherbaspirillum sp. ST9 TaxID=3401606 RepID=UPI003B58A2A2
MEHDSFLEETLERFREKRFHKIFFPEVTIIAALAVMAIFAGLIGCTLASGILAALAVGVCGFIPPQWHGWRERLDRAVQAKYEEFSHWGFHSRDRDFPWVAHIEGALILCAECAKDKFFYSEWLIIHDGLIIVNPGSYDVDDKTKEITYNHAVRRTYAWDGCTPKISWLWFVLIGTPDWWQKEFSIVRVSNHGHVEEATVFWPMTHYASVVHDALYQYLHHIPIKPSEVDRLFHTMLLEAGMWPWLAKLYYSLVKRCGGKDVKQSRQIPVAIPPANVPLLKQLGDACKGGNTRLPTLTSPEKSPLS